MRTFLLVFFIAVSSLSAQNTIASADIPEEHIAAKIPENNSIKIPLSLSSYSNYHGFNLQIDPLEKDIDYPILAGVGAITLGTGIAVHIYQRNAWWKDQRTNFHFRNDWNYSLWIDKIGHFYGSMLLSHLFSAGFEAGDVQSEQAQIYGSALALAFELYVEIEDGFGPDWGFSPGDATANILGSGYILAQYYFPYLKNFQFRFSYLPSQKLKDGVHRGNSIDDYEGQKYWLSLRMKNLLPEKAAKFWPSFLMISAGVGVKELDGSGGGYREYYIALDIDAEEIPLHGEFWQFVKNSFNYIHFPMPGIRITPNAAFFVFCF